MIESKVRAHKTNKHKNEKNMEFKVVNKNLIEDKAKRLNVIAGRSLIKNKAKKPNKIAGKSLDISIRNLEDTFKSIDIIRSIGAFRDFTKSGIIKKMQSAYKF